MELFLLLLIVVAVAIAIWWYRKRREERDRAARDPRREDPLATHGGVEDEVRALAPGAIVTLDERDHVVRGTLAFDQDGYTWSEHLLDDTSRRSWLSVEDDEGLEVGLWHRVSLADVDAGEPGDPEVTVGGVAYRLEERGNARFTARGTTGTSASGTAEYVDYRADVGKLLSFERFGSGSWEPAIGHTVRLEALTVYPAPEE